VKLIVNGRTVFATTGGTDFDPAKPAVVFLHGAGFDRTAWRLQTRWFAHHGRSVLAIDFPAHGWSDGPALDSIAAMADWTAALLDAAGLKDAALVGHSMGGLVALAAALAWPDKVGGLVLCGAAPRLPVSEALLAVVRDDYDAFPAWLAERALSPAAAPGLRRAFIAAGLVTSRATTLADYAAIAVTDLTSRLPEIKCPVVWLNGADDRIVAAPDAAMLPPNSEQAIVPDAGHLLPIEAPAVVAEAAGRLSLNRA
jgi:pimeloyl-ACP methyl ester carboxylesterase